MQLQNKQKQVDSLRLCEFPRKTGTFPLIRDRGSKMRATFYSVVRKKKAARNVQVVFCCILYVNWKGSEIRQCQLFHKRSLSKNQLLGLATFPNKTARFSSKGASQTAALSGSPPAVASLCSAADWPRLSVWVVVWLWPFDPATADQVPSLDYLEREGRDEDASPTRAGRWKWPLSKSYTADYPRRPHGRAPDSWSPSAVFTRRNGSTQHRREWRRL